MSGEGPKVAEAQLALAQMHLDRGEEAEALVWLRIAARSGDPRALNMLGRAHERGWGMTADPRKAAAYFRKAADGGDVWALFNLADLHCRGEGVEQDDAAACRLYAEAARQGLGKALNMLGLLHEEGRGVARSREAARQLFEAGAESGDCWAAFNAARLQIEDGDVSCALSLLERALETGFADFHRHMAALLRDHPDLRLRAMGRRASLLAGDALQEVAS